MKCGESLGFGLTEAQLPKALAPPRVHRADQSHDLGVTAPQIGRLERSGREQEQRIEYFFVQTGSGRELGVATFDGECESRAQRRLPFQVTRKMRESERHVAG